MNIEISPTGSVQKVTLAGRLDAAGVDQVEARFNAAVVASGRDAMVDLTSVPMITSMGIRMLIGAARAMSQRRRRLVLFGAQDLVREVLQNTAVDSVIALVSSEADALALVQH